MVNPSKLLSELLARDPTLQIKSVDENGNIVYAIDPTQEQQTVIQNVIDTHDPNKYSIEPSIDFVKGNGEHTISLQIEEKHYDGNHPSSVNMLVNGIGVSIDLNNGIGNVLIKSDTPGDTIVITGAAGGLANCTATIYSI